MVRKGEGDGLAKPSGDASGGSSHLFGRPLEAGELSEIGIAWRRNSCQDEKDPGQEGVLRRVREVIGLGHQSDLHSRHSRTATVHDGRKNGQSSQRYCHSGPSGSLVEGAGREGILHRGT